MLLRADKPWALGCMDHGAVQSGIVLALMSWRAGTAHYLCSPFQREVQHLQVVGIVV